MATLTKTTDGKNPRQVASLSDEEIGVMVGDLRKKLYTLRSQTVTDKVENNAQFKNIRRDIARLLTEKTVRSKKAN